MNEEKHTPGPWQIEPEFPLEVHKGHRIAVVENLVLHEAESRANARLIAAAPELLDAAKKADEQMTQALASWGGESQSMQDAINLVRAAILSATK